MDKIFKKVRYKNITVSFLPYLEGGGRNFGQEFIRVVKDKFGKVNHIFEYCHYLPIRFHLLPIHHLIFECWMK